MRDDRAAPLHRVEAFARPARGDPDVVASQRIGDRLAAAPLLARPIAKGAALLHDEKSRGALEKGVALREARKAQPQGRARRAPFAQPMLHDRERRARRGFLALYAKLPRLDREMALLGRKEPLRRLQTLHDDQVGGTLDVALLAQRPDELGAAPDDPLLRITRHIAARGERGGVEGGRGLYSGIGKLDEEQPPFAADEPELIVAKLEP